ncbi:MAG: response regulator transcription factor [Chloroflexi bacterium]|jgi:DNA-binding response OmpR family regulator|nr:response regulator transcription factor [Chloroflexota bacterium]MBK6711204.1 response regulator transcription factor [Chloroflexota bacterium]MBK7176208.1 response regulator transcription factor [Chloroflexota bacterium]MBK7915914.1 response regulator transcription factor [Chloroflexota bacterium]MBK8931103.1 response regulator transcription factor [Chloroflexota bacterium]
MGKDTILVVDDEANIRDLARMYLEKDGYRVDTMTNGRDALAYIKKTPPTLMVLDLMLPEIDGWEVCRRVRAESGLPIIMLTARDDDIDKIVGLEMGADDYLTKPFNPRELVARVRAILRRTTSLSDPTTGKARQAGNVLVDPASHEVTVAGERIVLRTKEFDLLITLMDHMNLVLSRDQLLDLVWGYEFYGRTRTVDVHVAHLREKLEGSSLTIETVWGKGYKLVATETA